MNDPKAIELLEIARKKEACNIRFAPYLEKAKAGVLQMSDLSKEDAVWLLGIVRPKAYWKELKETAKGHPTMVFLGEKMFP
jgi:hypothetical protein